MQSQHEATSLTLSSRSLAIAGSTSSTSSTSSAEAAEHWLLHPNILKRRLTTRFHVRFRAGSHYGRTVYTKFISDTGYAANSSSGFANQVATGGILVQFSTSSADSISKLIPVTWIVKHYRVQNENNNAIEFLPQKPKNNSYGIIIRVITKGDGMNIGEQVTFLRGSRNCSDVEIRDANGVKRVINVNDVCVFHNGSL